MADQSKKLGSLSESDLRLLAEKLKAKLGNIAPAMEREPIAIVGAGCRLPGGVKDLDSYWDLLSNARDAITEIPKRSWDADAYYDANPDVPGKMSTKWGGFVSDVEKFDANFFGISPREAEEMDPQQRLFLQVSWEALENAGQAPDMLFGSNASVFAGVFSHDYSDIQIGDKKLLNAYSGTGGNESIIAGRLSYFLGAQGPCLALNTACSSALVAVHLAVQSLRNKETDLAIAGGVNLILTPEKSIIFSKARMMASDGRCKTFDSRADGYVRSEGCGVLVLKRLSDALKSRDHIHAVIKGTAINQDGASNGLTAPNGPAQQALIRTALKNAGVKPSEVSYFETHGTGTPLGDPMEVNALGEVMKEGRGKDEPLWIGSVKSNIGHTESAAGVAGIIKVILGFRHRQIPANLHFKALNPSIEINSIPAKIPTELTSWDPKSKKRIASISSFGFSGTNANIVLEEPPAQPEVTSQSTRSAAVLTISARSPEALRNLADKYKDYLKSSPTADLGCVCYTSNVGRSHFEERLGIAGGSVVDLASKLEKFVKESAELGGSRAKIESGADKRVAFMFTGQGAQYTGMSKELYETQPTFSKALDKCAEILKSNLDKPLLSLLFGDHVLLLDQTKYTQPVLFALEYALAQLWISWGVEPAVVIGHSVGEYAAACVAGVFSLEDGLKLISKRAALMQALPGNGVMVSVTATRPVVEAALKGSEQYVSIAAVNGQQSIVIAGLAEHVDVVIKRLESSGVKSKALNVSHAFHSPQMGAMLDQFEAVAKEVKFNAPSVRFVSNLSGAVATPDLICAPGYWRRHVREAVLFSGGIEAILSMGVSGLLEIGPGTTLAGLVKLDLANPEKFKLFSSLKKGRGDWDQINETVAELYEAGFDFNWASFNAQTPARTKVELPTYAFDEKSYWTQSRSDHQMAGAVHPLLGRKLEPAVGSASIIFEAELSADSPAFLGDHVVCGEVVMPGASYMEMALSAATIALGGGPIQLDDLVFENPIIIQKGQTRTVQMVLSRTEDGVYSVNLFCRSWMNAAASQAWMPIMSGRVTRGVADNSAEVLGSDDELTEGLDVVDINEFYSTLFRYGLELRPRFNAVNSFWRNNDEGFARASLSSDGVAENIEYRLHPCLLDACMSLVLGRYHNSEERAKLWGDNVFLPLNVQKLKYYRQPTAGVVQCQVVFKNSDKFICGDFKIFDEKGNLAAEMIGLTFVEASRDILFKSLRKRDVTEALLEIKWEQAPALKIVPPADSQENWLILGDRAGIGDALAKVAAEAGKTVKLLKAEPQTNLESLVASAVEEGAYSKVVHLWSVDVASPANGAEGVDLEAQKLGYGVALTIAKSMLAKSMLRQTKLIAVTKGAQSVGVNQKIQAPFQAPVWGLGRTLALEQPELVFARIDLDPDLNDIEKSAKSLFDELIVLNTREDQIALRESRRYVARIEQIGAQGSKAKNPRGFEIKNDGSYLITGGLGGLGLHFANWLAEKGAGKIVLAGRSAPSEQTEKEIQALRDKGARVEVVSVDVADRKSAQHLIERLSKENLKGILHAAGTVADGYVMQQNWDKFLKVAGPKLAGTWNLHESTASMALDFFICFSSIASLFGNPGQSNYAAANAFIDAFAHMRKSSGLPATAINWGPWAKVGMAAKLDETGGGHFRENGLSYIEPEEGTLAMEKALGEGYPQVGVVI